MIAYQPMDPTDQDIYRQQRAILGLPPDDDHHQQTLRSLLQPPKEKVSLAEQKIRAQVLCEWEQAQENERLMLLQHKCNKLQYFLW